MIHSLISCHNSKAITCWLYVWSFVFSCDLRKTDVFVTAFIYGAFVSLISVLSTQCQLFCLKNTYSPICYRTRFLAVRIWHSWETCSDSSTTIRKAYALNSYNKLIDARIEAEWLLRVPSKEFTCLCHYTKSPSFISTIYPTLDELYNQVTNHEYSGYSILFTLADSTSVFSAENFEHTLPLLCKGHRYQLHGQTKTGRKHSDFG